MEQFQIEKFDIDASRCRISSDNYEVIVEPKVMDVLSFLYSHKGKVISQQQIFASVWPDATFNPSSVQRSIALLRKALKEDSKNSKFLKTHPKRGYSLDLPEKVLPKTLLPEKVQPETALPETAQPESALHETVQHENVQPTPSPFATEQSETTPLITDTPVTESGKPAISWYLPTIATALFIIMVLFWQVTQTNAIKIEFSRLLPVSSNENNESYMSLSPDGKYLAFVRGDDANKHIWIKELQSGKEVRLTSEDSNYNVLAWSPNGSAIAFMHYDENVQQRAMAYLSLDLIALKPLEQTLVYHFPEVHISGNQLQWSHENKIYFVEWNKQNSDTWLSNIDLTTNTKHRVQKSVGQDWLLTFALSPDHQQMALGYEVGQNRYRVVLFDVNNLKTKSLVTLEDSIQGLSWHPNGDSILVSNRTTLQLVDMDGDITVIDFDNYQFIRDAQYVPGGDEIFMELRNVDVDIMRTTKSSPKEFETLVDTSSLDFFPIFSPDDQRFVFQSHRTGIKQLYLYENGQQRLIFSNPNNEELFGTVWSPDGKQVIAASKDKLFRIDIETANYQETHHPHNPFYLREHFKHDNAILVSYRAADGITFHLAKLDLSSMALTEYSSSGERLVCYSMTLDNQDHIHFTNGNEVFRLNSDATTESLWRSKGAKISGLTINDKVITVLLDEDKQFLLTRINLENGTTTIIHQGLEDGTMLTNSSHDQQQFLYLSKPERTSKLVRLQ